MQRNGFYLASPNSTLITVQYMLDIKDGVTWCPLYEDVRIRPCPRKPLKQLIIQEVKNELKKKDGNLSNWIDEKHQPDVEWLLVILATLNPEHRYFQKQYVPQLNELRKTHFEQKEGEEEQDQEFHVDEFFKDLPQDITSNFKGKVNSMKKTRD